MNKPIIIFIPFPEDGYEVAKDFYLKKLRMQFVKGNFIFPNIEDVVLKLRLCEKIVEINKKFWNVRFSCVIKEENVCGVYKSWIESGVGAVSLSGNGENFTVKINDPFGNKINLTYENFFK